MRNLEDEFFNHAPKGHSGKAINEAVLNSIFRDYLKFMKGAYSYVEQYVRNQ